MNLRKRLRVLGLLLIGLILVGSTAAQAQTLGPFTETLFPTTAAPRGAAGEAVLSGLTFDGFTWYYFDDPDFGWNCAEEYSGTLTIRCTGLKPSTTYRSDDFGSFKTNSTGGATISGPVQFGFVWWYEGGALVTSGPDFPFQVIVRNSSRKLVFIGEFPYALFNNGSRVPSPPSSR
jgi:hypothetical protein